MPLAGTHTLDELVILNSLTLRPCTLTAARLPTQLGLDRNHVQAILQLSIGIMICTLVVVVRYVHMLVTLRE